MLEMVFKIQLFVAFIACCCINDTVTIRKLINKIYLDWGYRFLEDSAGILE